MPKFYERVDVDIDVEVNEFIGCCDPDEIKEIIQYLRDGGYLNSSNMTDTEISYMEETHQIYCNHLRSSYLQISNEDLDIIKNLAKKYGAY